MNHSIYLAFGSNLGSREETIRRAFKLLESEGLKPVSVAPCMLTKPEGFCSENLFLNTAGEFSTMLSPVEALEATQRVERELGRTQKSENGVYHDRTIDIDILFYDDIVVFTPQLVIPHPHLCERRFVLQPLAAIAPDLKHPVNGKTIREILDALQ